MPIKTKRIYEKPEKSDGARVLIDRLWPRGLTKEKAKIDLWLRDIAPSSGLRKWFGHDPAKWPEFEERYIKELKNNKEITDILKKRAKKETLTLVYGAKDQERNDAVVLKNFLNKTP